MPSYAMDTKMMEIFLDFTLIGDGEETIMVTFISDHWNLELEVLEVEKGVTTTVITLSLV